MSERRIHLDTPTACDGRRRGEHFVQLLLGTPEGGAFLSDPLSLGSKRLEADKPKPILRRAIDMAQEAGWNTDFVIGADVTRRCWARSHHGTFWERVVSYALAAPSAPRVLIDPDSLSTDENGVGIARPLLRPTVVIRPVVDYSTLPGEREPYAVVKADCSTPERAFHIVTRLKEFFVPQAMLQ